MSGRRKIIAIMQAELMILGDGCFGLLPPRLIMTKRMDAARARLLRQPGQDFVRLALAQNEPGALAFERRRQRRKAVVRPPALGAADPPIAWRLVVEHVDGDDRTSTRGRRECGLVGETKILPEPDDG